MARIVVMGAGIGGISHLARIAYEKYFLHKVRAAKTEPYYEKTVLKLVGAMRLKESA